MRASSRCHWNACSRWLGLRKLSIVTLNLESYRNLAEGAFSEAGPVDYDTAQSLSLAILALLPVAEASQQAVRAWAVWTREADHLGSEPAEISLGDAIDRLFVMVGEATDDPT